MSDFWHRPHHTETIILVFGVRAILWWTCLEINNKEHLNELLLASFIGYLLPLFPLFWKPRKVRNCRDILVQTSLVYNHQFPPVNLSSKRPVFLLRRAQYFACGLCCWRVQRLTHIRVVLIPIELPFCLNWEEKNVLVPGTSTWYLRGSRPRRGWRSKISKWSDLTQNWVLGRSRWTVGRRRRVVVVWKIVAQVLYVPAVFQCWGEGLRWWAEGAEVFQLLWPKYAVGFFK